jgi:uncharacterized protein YecT (DUF1311 family)
MTKIFGIDVHCFDENGYEDKAMQKKFDKLDKKINKAYKKSDEQIKKLREQEEKDIHKDTQTFDVD